MNSKVNETYQKKYQTEGLFITYHFLIRNSHLVTVFNNDLIEKSNRSIEKQVANIDRMYDLISNLEEIDSMRPEMIASDWMASGSVENDLRAHRLDAKNNLLKILEAKEKEVDNEIKSKEFESKRNGSSIQDQSYLYIYMGRIGQSVGQSVGWLFAHLLVFELLKELA